MKNSTSEIDSIDIKPLEVLGHALEISFWTKRKFNFPYSLQLEFDCTDLYFEPVKKYESPKTEIVIEFINPKSVSFLCSKNNEEDIADLIDKEAFALDCTKGRFTFTDNELKKKIIREMKTINSIHGYSPKEVAFYEEKYSLVFVAEN